MKIKQLHIDSYRHLENLKFDFTYPVGHAKAGKVLDKICIVGQSATGKTSVLELIKDNFAGLEHLGNIGVFDKNYRLQPYQLNFKGKVEYESEGFSLVLGNNKVVRNGLEIIYYANDTVGAVPVNDLFDEKLRLLYFSSETIAKEAIAILNQSPIDISASEENQLAVITDNQNYLYKFLQSGEKDLWISLLSKILDYRKRFTQMASELINQGAIGDLQKLNREYTKWSAANENPLISFAKYFNPILEKLNLEIDLVNTEYSIPIKSKINDKVIPISGLSTGTKGLLLSMFPLFELNTAESIILLDEPERSLFPDMQIELMGHYQHIAPEAQFIVATHSPFIAAAFEPEERFILYFDKQGKVAVRRGESPIGDDPNDILMNDFKVDYYNHFGKQAYQNYLELRRKLSQETEIEKKNELLVELTELGDKYNF